MKNIKIKNMIILSGMVLFVGCNDNSGVFSIGDNKMSSLGFISMQDNKLNSFKNNGAANLEDVEILGDASVNGTLNGKSLIVNKNLNVNGSIQLEQSSVKGIAHVNGFLSGKDSEFFKIDIATDNLFLQGCKVAQDIFVKKPCRQKVQVVELVKTSIGGDIVFESGMGKVILKDGSVIKGSVRGGVVEK